MREPKTGGLAEVAGAFSKLGLVAFGGPAAHIAMFEEEFVSRRGWVTQQHFLDLVGATNLIPGPNSTEMTMHLGYERAGWKGLFVAGSCFIAPAVMLTALFAWLYVRYGTLVQAESMLAGIKPVVIAIILGALWRLGKKALKGWRLGFLGALVGMAVLSGVGQVAALFAGGLLGMLWLRAVEEPSSSATRLLPLLFLQQTSTAKAAVVGTSPVGFSLAKLFWFFLKIGAMLYGSGYVLVAFLEGGLVNDYGWLTSDQLVDAIALGQLTPGPVLSTSTFVGFLVAGLPGAVVATVGIFLPSFLFVWMANPLIPRLRQSAWLSAFLDSVNVAALALMVAVVINLGWVTLLTWPTWILFLTTAVLSLRFKVNSAWLIIGGAIAGALVGGLA